jgi:hypothetical protein
MRVPTNRPSEWMARIARAARDWLGKPLPRAHRRGVRFDIDYLALPAPTRTLGVILFALGFVLSGHAAYTYGTAAHKVDELSARLVMLEAAHAKETDAPVPRLKPITAEEVDAVQDVRRRLTLPWPDVFEPLEAVRPMGVRLTSIEPDPKTRMLTISGEARDYLLVLGYVASLSTASGLRDVELLRHETQTSDPQFPTAFAVTARWRAAP